MASDLLTVFFASALIAGLPILLAALGEQAAERTGVINVGLEGMMVAGAFAGFFAVWLTGSVWLGFLAGIGGGLVLGVAMSVLGVWLGCNQIIVGIALTLTVEGVTAMTHRVLFSRTYPRLPAVESWSVPLLEHLPWIGKALFNQHPVVYIALLIVPLQAFVLRSTHVGLNMTAAGDKPTALDATGVSVLRTRVLATLYASGMAGLGGATLSIIGAGVFVPFMTNGAGFIGIVLAMLAAGRPGLVLVGALVFGASLSLTSILQISGVDVSPDFIQMLPYVMVLLVLILFARRTALPPALGEAYVRGAR